MCEAPFQALVELLPSYFVTLYLSLLDCPIWN